MVNSLPLKNPEPPELSGLSNEPFRTPEEVAATDLKPGAGHSSPSSMGPNVPKRKFNLRNRWLALSKKQKALSLIITGIVVLGIAVGLIFIPTRHQPGKPKPAAVIAKPTTVPSTLTGLPVNPNVNKRPVTGVMIENSLDARPQSGLDQAGVVFEAVAEGGITRFLALFQDTQPSYIGPVRSARPYYLQWALGFDAAYAHVGGSPDALNDIQTWQVRDLDEFYNAGAYERVASRAAPHNVYTSIAQLRALETSKGFITSHFNGFPRKSDSPAKTPTAANINFSLSGSDYAVNYIYNSKTNNYLRSEGGQPHMEVAKNGKLTRVTPKVVIAIVVPESQGALDASGAYYSEYAAIGSGKAYVFQDGTVTVGTWHKSSNTTQITFTNAQGQTIKLNAGQTWITAVSIASNVTYKP